MRSSLVCKEIWVCKGRLWPAPPLHMNLNVQRSYSYLTNRSACLYLLTSISTSAQRLSYALDPYGIIGCTHTKHDSNHMFSLPENAIFCHSLSSKYHTLFFSLVSFRSTFKNVVCFLEESHSTGPFPSSRLCRLTSHHHQTSLLLFLCNNQTPTTMASPYGMTSPFNMDASQEQDEFPKRSMRG